MLPSPLTVTIAGTAHALSLINQDNFGSKYFKKGTDLEISLSIRHSYENKDAAGVQMERHNVDLTYTTYDATGKPTVYQAYTVMRTRRGLASAQVVEVTKGLNTLVSAQAAAIANWES